MASKPESKTIKVVQSLIAFACWEEIVNTGAQCRQHGLAKAMATIYNGDGRSIESKVTAFMEGKGRFEHIWVDDKIADVFGKPIAGSNKRSFGENANFLRQASTTKEGSEVMLQNCVVVSNCSLSQMM